MQYEKLTAGTVEAFRAALGSLRPFSVIVRFRAGNTDFARQVLEANGLQIAMLLPNGVCTGTIRPNDLDRLSGLDIISKIDIPALARAR